LFVFGDLELKDAVGLENETNHDQGWCGDEELGESFEPS
jgi:hypothetical protein